MTNIFISYSRRNKEFTQQLVDALTAAKREVWADWQNIPAASDWDAEIKEGIRNTESVLFVLSPEWVKSAECRKELDYALLMGKRLITILHQPIEYSDLPPDLKKINWIDMRDPDHFESRFQTVCAALDTDLDWIKTHTRIQVRAVEWDKKNRDNSFTLRGKDLTDGEQFIAGAADKNPAPTVLQSEYILASRKDATRRSRITLAGISVALVVSVVLGVLAWFQRQAAVTAEATAVVERDRAVVAQNTAVSAEATAVANEKEAKRQLAISRSGELAAQSTGLRDKNYQLALLLGIEGYRKFDTLQSRKALLDATNGSPLGQALTLSQGSSIQGETFSPDGKVYASVSTDNSIRLWNVTKGQLIGQPLKGHHGAISSIIFSSDGKTLVSSGCAEPQTNSLCSNGEAFLWNVETQQLMGQPISGFGGIRSLALTPDGKKLATLSYQTVSVDSEIYRSGYSVVLWDTGTHQPAGNQVQWPEGTVPDSINGYGLAISRDGRTLAAAIERSDGLMLYKEIILWNVETGEIIKIHSTDATFAGGGGPLTFSPDGSKIVFYDWWGGTTVWDVNSQSEKWLEGSVATTSIALSTDGKTLAVATFEQGDSTEPAEGVINFWDMDEFKIIGSKLIGFHPEGRIGTMTFSPDGNTLFSSVIGHVKIFNQPRTDQSYYEPLGQLIFGGSDNADPSNRMLMAFSPDGKTLAVNDGTKKITLWDVQKRTPSQPSIDGGIFAYSPEGGTIASVADQGILLWDVVKQQSVELPMDTNNLTGIALGPNAHSLVSYSSSSAEITTWDIKNPDTFNSTRQSFAVLPGDQQATIDSIALSPTGKILAVGGYQAGGSLTLWDMDTHKQIGDPLLVQAGQILDLKFSADGSILLSSVNETITLWDVATQTPIGQPFSGWHPVLSADNTTLALIDIPGVGADYSGSISLWDIKTHQILGRPLSDPNVAIDIAISPDGKRLATMGRRGEVILWDLDPNSWVDLNCQRVGRNLTRAEWAQYFPTEEYRKTCDQWPLEEQDTPTTDLGSALPTQPTATEAPAVAESSTVGLILPFEDDFSDNSRWGTATDTNSSVTYEGEALRMQLSQTDWIVWSTTSLDDQGSIHAEVTATHKDAEDTTKFGILCFKQADLASYYYAALASNGQYAIGRAMDGREDVVLSNNGQWAQSSLIETNQPSYRVGMDCGNGTISLYVDGKKIDSVSDSAYASGQIGLFTWSGSNAPVGDVTFDDFLLASLGPQEGAVPTEAPPVEGGSPTESPALSTANAFTEEFDGSMDSWSTFMTSGIDRQVKTSLEGGNLNVQLVISEGKLPMAYWINDAATYSTVQVEAVVTNNGNNSNGVSLVCQYSDAGWYEFTVSNAGIYTIYAYDPARLKEERHQELIAGGSTAIKSGLTTNTYTAVCNGNELSLSINGTLVNTYTDSRYNYTEGKIGFGISSPNRIPIDVTIESLAVSIPE